jgi:hypothetical protein
MRGICSNFNQQNIFFFFSIFLKIGMQIWQATGNQNDFKRSLTLSGDSNPEQKLACNNSITDLFFSYKHLSFTSLIACRLATIKMS